MRERPTPSLQMASGAEIAVRLRGTIGRLRRGTREAAPVLTRPLLLLAGLGALLTLFLLPFDEQIALSVRGWTGSPRAVLEIVTDIALIKWYFYPALALALIALLVSRRAAPRHARLGHVRFGVHAAYLAASLGTASTITHAIKYAIGRARPERVLDLGPFDLAVLRLGSAYESFPSGHSTNAGVLAMVLAIWFPRLRWPFLAAGACLALTRIAVEAHYASDVAAGFTIGALTALVLARWLARRRLVYRLAADGTGWRGLLPRRSGPCGAGRAAFRNRP